MPLIPRVQHGEEISRTILPARRRPLAADDLVRKLEPVMADWVAAAADWDGLGLGESRCLVFETDLADGVTFFVRFWSEPMAPLLCEVASGRGDNALAARLLPGAHQWMEAGGFAIQGERQNYRGHVPIETADGIASAAAFAASALIAVAGYQGLTPLYAMLAHDSRALWQDTLDSFTEEEVARVFAAAGFRISWTDPEALEPVFNCRKAGTESTIRLLDPAPGTRLYRRVHFSADLPMIHAVADICRKEGKEVSANDTMVSISGFHAFTGGVTREWLVERVHEWDRALAEHRRELRRERKDKSKRPATPTTETIH